MLSNVLLTCLSLLSVTTALPSSLGARSPTDTLSILVSRGIDPSGPIPSDATPLPNGGFSFAADSDASHWARAQALVKRGSSGLSITLWGDGHCGGPGAFFGNVQYGNSNVGERDFYLSVQYSGRALLDNEQMDLSKLVPNGSDKCARYVRTLGPRTPPGCYADGNSYSCMRLLTR